MSAKSPCARNLLGKARDMIEILKTIERPDYYIDLISLPLAELKQKYLDARKVDDIIFYGYLYQQKKMLWTSITTTSSLSRCIFSTISPILR